MDKTYDLIIIGAGPAGITAGIYAARKKLDCLILTVDIGGQTIWSGNVENYTGYQFISGSELAAKFEEHISKYGLVVNENEPVTSIKKENEWISVETSKSRYKAKAVIVASGKKSRELDVPGEAEYKNKGLTYCATCDGPLFSGKDVVIIGGGNSALDAAIGLVKIAKSVTILTIDPDFTGDPIMKEKVTSSSNVKVYYKSRITEVFGERFVEGVKVETDGKEEKIPCKGVFVEVGLVPNSDFAGILNKNDKGEIIINCQTQTNVEGIFAAGDVTNVVEKQIIISAGEGAKASLAAFRYLARL